MFLMLDIGAGVSFVLHVQNYTFAYTSAYAVETLQACFVAKQAYIVAEILNECSSMFCILLFHFKRVGNADVIQYSMELLYNMIVMFLCQNLVPE